MYRFGGKGILRNYIYIYVDESYVYPLENEGELTYVVMLFGDLVTEVCSGYVI